MALLCYSHGLASYLTRLVGGWKYTERPAYVGEFHQLGIEWGAATGPDESVVSDAAQHFWEHELPNEMTDLAEALDPGHRFDAIVIDEAQDFADEWWRPILACLRDPDDSGVYVFSDEAQRVFDRHGAPPVPLVPLLLDQNLRNTRQIASAFSPLVGQRMQLRGGEGPDVRFVACTPDEALGCADDQSTCYSTTAGVSRTSLCSQPVAGTMSRSRGNSKGHRLIGTPSGTTIKSSTATSSGSKAWSGASSFSH